MRSVKIAGGMVLKVTYKHNNHKWTSTQFVEVNDTAALIVINKKNGQDFLHWTEIYNRAMATAARRAVKKRWTTSPVTILSVERVDNI